MDSKQLIYKKPESKIKGGAIAKVKPPPKDISSGYICIMTHSFFSDVILIVSSMEMPERIAENFSKKTPGEYSVAFSQFCERPDEIKRKVEASLNGIECVQGFYDASPAQAIKLIQRELMRIPAFDLH